MIYKIPYGAPGEFVEMEDPIISLKGGMSTPDLRVVMANTTVSLTILFTGPNPFADVPETGVIAHETPYLPFELGPNGVPEFTEAQLTTILTGYLSTLIKP
jgi:exosome complex RNA-binding protein Rrp42 (RNase PH superfamily)